MERHASPASHWDEVYATKAADSVSWFEPSPVTSLRLVTSVASSGRVIDVGAGASTLADGLVSRGYDVTVLDVSEASLDLVRQRLGSQVTYVVSNVLTWLPEAIVDVWHDRAVFHFLTTSADQQCYASLARQAVREGGALIVGTFALDGPTTCSGLPTARYDADTLAAVFSDGFVLEHHERVEHHTPWDAIQPFTWVVLRRATK